MPLCRRLTALQHSYCLMLSVQGPMEKLPKTAPASIKDINSNSERAKPTNQTPPKDGADLVAKEVCAAVTTF